MFGDYQYSRPYTRKTTYLTAPNGPVKVQEVRLIDLLHFGQTVGTFTLDLEEHDEDSAANRSHLTP